MYIFEKVAREPGAYVWLVFKLSLLWVLLGGDSFSEASYMWAGRTKHLSPPGLMVPGQTMLKGPALQCSTSWSLPQLLRRISTPLTARAHVLCNLLRGSEVWGNERKRKRLDTLKQKGSVHLCSFGEGKGGLILTRSSPLYLLTSHVQ